MPLKALTTMSGAFRTNMVLMEVEQKKEKRTLQQGLNLTSYDKYQHLNLKFI